MTTNYYQLDLLLRRRMLADAGFVRDGMRVWTHVDGRAIGESVAAALTDAAFCRFLRVEPPPAQAEQKEALAEAAQRDF
jgi:hypothetical protein